MKILHVITGFGKAAGTTVFCGKTCVGLASAGHDVSLAVLDPDEPGRYSAGEDVKMVSISSVLAGGLETKPDIVHFHVIWLPVMHRLREWADANGIPIVWSPHGTLTPWAMRHRWWKKWPAWWMFQKKDLAASALLHATAPAEVADFRRMGLRNRICTIPLGVDMPDDSASRSAESGVVKTLLFASRVQKKKGLPNLVRAWAALDPAIRNGWHVRIVGPDQENHAAEVAALCRNLGVEKDFTIAGPKFGADLDAEYAGADLFVLPTHSENFGSVVVEAMAHALPVITTKGAPWEEVETRKCGWWVEIGAEPLARALGAAMSLDDAARREMGLRGRRLAEEKYTWKAVVEKLERAYVQVLQGE